jgi:hypothetical protein
MRAWHWLVLILSILPLAGCGQPDVDLTYSTNPEDLIVQANSAGGYVPDAYVESHIPDFRLYGDGRVVWVEWQDDQTKVWQGHLEADEIAALLRWIADKRFFGMKNHYAPKNPPTDLATDCVSLTLVNVQKTVCEYHSGAPKAFWEIYGRLGSGADASDVQPYQPDKGWVIVEPITWDTTAEAVAWPDSLTPSPATMGDGAWVQGDLLHFLWQGRLEQGAWMVYEEDDRYYGLVLQVPGLMPLAPSGP